MKLIILKYEYKFLFAPPFTITGKYKIPLAS